MTKTVMMLIGSGSVNPFWACVSIYFNAFQYSEAFCTCTPCKCQKTSDFLTFSGGIECFSIQEIIEINRSSGTKWVKNEIL